MIAQDDSEFLLALGNVPRDITALNRALGVLSTQMQATRATLYTEDTVFGQAPPRPACFAALRPNRVYGADELADRAGPFDPDFSAGDARVIAAPAPKLWLWVHKARGIFRAADSARLSTLMPHIAQTVALAQDYATLLHAATDATALARRAGLGRIGPEGPNLAAAALLAETGAAPGQITPGTYRSLSRTVSAYGLPDGTAILRKTRPLPPPEHLAQALGLTLSEARLARALGEGLPLPQATAHLGLTRETGRSYAKQIYAKTGVSGQSGLVRLLWCGALAFG